ncbi:MAG TPA: SLBB domain-containing protein, partial [Roseomonas sp.]
MVVVQGAAQPEREAELSVRSKAGRAGRLAASLLLILQAGPARAQGQPLMPPSLPSTLPGGLPLPNLPSGPQQDILQRILDAAGGRMPVPAAPPPVPAPHLPSPLPQASPAPLQLRADSGEPLSNTEAFFAARLPEQQPPLRQFGYDTFRNLAPVPGAGSAVMGALPDSYVLGRDDEVVVAIRGRSRQSLSLRVGRDGMLTLPDLAPFPAAGRTLRELRADIEARVARELGGSEAFVSIGQTRQIAVFVAGEVVRPGLVPLAAISSLLDALGAAGGIRRTGSLRAVRVEGPGGARVVDLYAAIAGTPGTPDLSLREGERVVVPPLGGVVALGGDVTRPAIYELPAGAGAAPLSIMLALAGGALRPAGNRFLATGTDAGGRRAMSELSPGSALRRGDAVIISPGADVM